MLIIKVSSKFFHFLALSVSSLHLVKIVCSIMFGVADTLLLFRCVVMPLPSIRYRSH